MFELTKHVMTETSVILSYSNYKSIEAEWNFSVFHI